MPKIHEEANDRRKMYKITKNWIPTHPTTDHSHLKPKSVILPDKTRNIKGKKLNAEIIPSSVDDKDDFTDDKIHKILLLVNRMISDANTTPIQISILQDIKNILTEVNLGAKMAKKQTPLKGEAKVKRKRAKERVKEKFSLLKRVKRAEATIDTTIDDAFMTTIEGYSFYIFNPEDVNFYNSARITLGKYAKAKPTFFDHIATRWTSFKVNEGINIAIITKDVRLKPRAIVSVFYANQKDPMKVIVGEILHPRAFSEMEGRHFTGPGGEEGEEESTEGGGFVFSTSPEENSPGRYIPNKDFLRINRYMWTHLASQDDFTAITIKDFSTSGGYAKVIRYMEFDINGKSAELSKLTNGELFRYSNTVFINDELHEKITLHVVSSEEDVITTNPLVKTLMKTLDNKVYYARGKKGDSVRIPEGENISFASLMTKPNSYVLVYTYEPKLLIHGTIKIVYSVALLGKREKNTLAFDIYYPIGRKHRLTLSVYKKLMKLSVWGVKDLLFTDKLIPANSFSSRLKIQWNPKYHGRVIYEKRDIQIRSIIFENVKEVYDSEFVRLDPVIKMIYEGNEFFYINYNSPTIFYLTVNGEPASARGFKSEKFTMKEGFFYEAAGTNTREKFRNKGYAKLVTKFAEKVLVRNGINFIVLFAVDSARMFWTKMKYISMPMSEYKLKVIGSNMENIKKGLPQIKSRYRDNEMDEDEFKDLISCDTKPCI